MGRRRTPGLWGPDGATRLVVATTDPAALPDTSSWYLATNLPRPGSPGAAGSPHQAADLAELVQLYGIRNWIEQRYKQVKDELGWADFQVRSDVAIRRHQTLVNCAFSFCWEARAATAIASQTAPAGCGGQPARAGGPSDRLHPAAVLAEGDPRRPQLANPSDRAARWWQAWSKAPPPTELQALLTAVTAGQALNLYTPN